MKQSVGSTQINSVCIFYNTSTFYKACRNNSSVLSGPHSISVKHKSIREGAFILDLRTRTVWPEKKMPAQDKAWIQKQLISGSSENQFFVWIRVRLFLSVRKIGRALKTPAPTHTRSHIHSSGLWSLLIQSALPDPPNSNLCTTLK